MKETPFNDIQLNIEDLGAATGYNTIFSTLMSSQLHPDSGEESEELMSFLANKCFVSVQEYTFK